MYSVQDYTFLSKALSQEAKQHHRSRLKKIQQQLGTYRQCQSRIVIKTQIRKDIEGRNTN